MASSSHLKPGGREKINTKVNIKGRTGMLSKSVQVHSNDPKRPSVTLLLKAIIK